MNMGLVRRIADLVDDYVVGSDTRAEAIEALELVTERLKQEHQADLEMAYRDDLDESHDFYHPR